MKTIERTLWILSIFPFFIFSAIFIMPLVMYQTYDIEENKIVNYLSKIIFNWYDHIFEWKTILKDRELKIKFEQELFNMLPKKNQRFFKLQKLNKKWYQL